MPLSTTQAMKSEGKRKEGDAPNISGCILRKAGLISKPLLSATALLAGALALIGFSAESHAQPSRANQGPDIADTWQGTLHAGKELRAPTIPPDADPSFEVATIKPSLPNRPGKSVGFRGTHYMTSNTNVNDLIALAYGVHAKQIFGGPDWFGTALYDIDGKPDTEGLPSGKQITVMLQKLLAERFHLVFHREKKELPVYVISVSNGGPKLTMSGPDSRTAFSLRRPGDLLVTNMTIANFAIWMQAGVMDKPVVDKTGLPDTYDFALKWTPDESQFAQFRGTGAVVPPPTNDPNAPPSLYTAMQEQLGLEMGPAKSVVNVIVIDHAEKPSEN